MEHQLAGVLPVVQTPFTASGDIDEGGLRRLSRWVLAEGADGLTTGMVSEILKLSTPERVRLNEIVIDVARDQGAVAVLSAGAESTRNAVELAVAAEEAGGNALMVAAPISVSLDEASVMTYYRSVIDAVQIPVVVQDASGYVGEPLSIDLQARLLGLYPDRVYFKPEARPIGPRLSLLRDATDGKAPIIEGTGGIALLDSFRRGIVATMPGSEMCWAIVRMWRAMVAGDFEAAYALNAHLVPLLSLQSNLDSFVAVEKHLLRRQGVLGSEAVRLPVGFALDDETRTEVDRLFGRLLAHVGRELTNARELV